MLLYKYLVSHRIDVLKNSRIRFTQPAALNDPFEAYPCFEDFKNAAIELLLTHPDHASIYAGFEIENLNLTNEQKEVLRKGKEDNPDLYDDYMKNIITMVMGVVSDSTLEKQRARFIDGNFALLSLSKKRDNPLMWSHYADSHRGFVIGLDTESPFFEPGGKMATAGLRDVQYSHDRYVVPKDGFNSLSIDELHRANIGWFFNKSIDWDYEEEVRILAHPKQADHTLDIPGGQPIYLYNFPVECVREVLFGFRMDCTMIDEIREVCGRKYPDAKLFRASMHERKFAMRVTAFDSKLTSSELRRMEEFYSSPLAKRVLNNRTP